MSADYLTAVTPSVTSSTMVLRRNIGHCYTDWVTIMAAVGRRTARPELVSPVLTQGASGPARRFCALMKRKLNVRIDKPAIPPVERSSSYFAVDRLIRSKQTNS
jgi:hypothetical protein